MAEQSLPAISRHLIQQNTTEQIFERGETYYQEGAVHNTTREGKTLKAHVEGSQYKPYHVIVTFDKLGIKAISCTCPYDYSGYCKHQVAVMLAYLDNPKQFTLLLPIEDVLKSVSSDELQTHVLQLLKEKPELASWFRQHIDSMPPVAEIPQQKRKTPVDTKRYRQEIRRVVQSIDYHRHWEAIWDTISALENAHKKAQTFLKVAEFDNALALMRVFGDEVILKYEEIESEDQLANFLESWSDDLTEAVMAAELSDDEQKELLEQLHEWDAMLNSYALDDLLINSIRICEQGITADSDIPLSPELVEAQLNVLEQRGDTEQYLEMCLKHDAHYRYAACLIGRNRIEEAMNYALKQSMLAQEHLWLAQKLREHGYVDEAYEIGMKGLDAPGQRYQLAQWIAELAEAAGRINDAKRAWQIAFKELPSLEHYQTLKRLSGDEWNTIQEKLLAHIRNTTHTNILIEILIEENRIEEAIHHWDEDRHYSGYELLEKLVNASQETHPDWAIKKSLSQARALINKASKYYPRAVQWLKKVKAIYESHDRQKEWHQCIADIRSTHGRKYSLMAQFDKHL